MKPLAFLEKAGITDLDFRIENPDDPIDRTRQIIFHDLHNAVKGHDDIAPTLIPVLNQIIHSGISTATGPLSKDNTVAMQLALLETRLKSSVMGAFAT